MGRIVLANHKGDEVIATFDPRNVESLQVAQARLTRFLEDCVKQFGTKPPVWGRHAAKPSSNPFRETFRRRKRSCCSRRLSAVRPGDGG